ncbi:MAG: esterase family protein [Acidobacteria bacterium]|nr:MAG: esterase family protein [Acidobacteriota bacterium]
MRLRLAAALIVIVGVIAYLTTTTRAPEEDRAARPQLVAIETGKTPVPVVTATDITFYAEGDSSSPPRIVSDLTGWGERADGTFDFSVGKMHQIPGTKWFSLSARADKAARIEYLIAYGAGDYRLDPRNSRKVARVGGEASEVVMPAYVAPPEFDAPPTAPAGKLTEAVVKGLIVGQRRVIVYTPPGYDPSRRYRLAVFHDGGLVVNTGEAPRVLDWLIAHDAIEPVIGVFVDPVSRTDDFRRAAPMRDFVCRELMSWITARYSITPVAADHAIIGVSAGARGALDAMAAYPGVFGKSGLMIPAVTEDDVLRIPVRRGEAEQLEVAVLAGEYDRLNIAGAELVRASVLSRGHLVTFLRVPEGHTTATWKTHLRDVMISLFGR